MFPPRVRKGRLRSEERCTGMEKKEIQASISTLNRESFLQQFHGESRRSATRLNLRRTFYYCHCHDFCLFIEVFLLALKDQKLICSVEEARMRLGLRNLASLNRMNIFLPACQESAAWVHPVDVLFVQIRTSLYKCQINFYKKYTHEVYFGRKCNPSCLMISNWAVGHSNSKKLNGDNRFCNLFVVHRVFNFKTLQTMTVSTKKCLKCFHWKPPIGFQK